MLLANVSVAKQIYKFFPAFALLRRHPPPRMRYITAPLILFESLWLVCCVSQFKELVELVKKTNVDLDISSSKNLAESLDRAVKSDDPYFNQLVRILSTRCMTPAIYFSSGSIAQSEFYHYGLATPIYTHFTSPIRRYAGMFSIFCGTPLPTFWLFLQMSWFIDCSPHPSALPRSLLSLPNAMSRTSAPWLIAAIAWPILQVRIYSLYL